MHLGCAKELAHMEMICAIVHQLTKNLSPEEIERSGFAPYYVDHTLACEIVHYQRFGENLRIVQEHLDSKNFYAFNPEFDKNPNCGCKRS